VDADLVDITDETVDVPLLLEKLSRAGQIRPYPTWGRLADRQPHQLAHDAGSTIGGSGGPMFSMSGRVIGVNNAVSRDFDSAGLGVPIHEAKVPLAQARRPRG
jgi:S1-C subfamily serine protease